MSAQNTARGDYAHPMPGVMRPLLQWRTRRLEQPLDTIEIAPPLNGMAATGTTR
jgi:hypothetical protein